jgi:superfamily II DNA or RNA helicase
MLYRDNEKSYKDLKQENDQLREQIKYLEARLARYERPNRQELWVTPQNETREVTFDVRSKRKSRVDRNSSREEKLSLFRSLFQGRTDVYAKRWEGRNGKSGYSFACANDRVPHICHKPAVKCSNCSHRKYLPLTDEVLLQHLNITTQVTIGIYPLLHDETCLFLAVDFDKSNWQEDALAFIKVCREHNIPAALERSRSGNGAHVWIFFEEPISAALARNMGSGLLTYTMEQRHQLSLESYDRLFPNQDTMPKGGLGNLIALPLQGVAWKQGNSVFVNERFEVYPDQWAFLSSLRKIKSSEVESFVNKAKKGSILGILNNPITEEDQPWIHLFPRDQPAKRVTGPLPERLSIIKGNLMYINTENLSSTMINHLKRLAAFQNPEFYEAQAMRMSTYGKPRIISCAEEFPRYLALPRGCMNELERTLKDLNILSEIKDERYIGMPIEVQFSGELREKQKDAVQSLLAFDTGILFATTAFGKTVVAAWMLAARGVNTLIMVHRKQLMEQWKEKLAVFLNVSPKEIGQIGGGKNKRTGKIDIALMQSLNRKGEVKEFVADYGHVIADECHHLSAFTFEQILKKVNAKYVLGLTATPIRKDGHHPIIMMQCGPIRYRVDAKTQAESRPFEHLVVPRFTRFTVGQQGDHSLSIQDIYSLLIDDQQRNDMIFDDLLMSLEQGRTPLLLTERTAHVEYFANRLKSFVKHVLVLRGGMGKKQLNAVLEQLKQIPEQEERVLIATGRFIGEGFDDPRLDTLFLTMPVSWKGTLQQYSGRLHRMHPNKNLVQVYDYVDRNVPVLLRMYEKRKKGYENMGYKMEEEISIQESFNL